MVEFMYREVVFGYSNPVTFIAGEGCLSVVMYNMVVSVSSVSKELWTMRAFMFVSGLFFVGHVVEGMSVFHMH